MSKILWIVLAGAMALPAAAGAQVRKIPLDRAKILVDSRMITERELKAFRELRAVQAKQQYKGDRLAKELDGLDARIVDEMIETLLLENRAESLEINVSDDDIDKRVDAILARDPTASDIYSDAELKEYVLAEILKGRVLQREVLSRLFISKKQIQQSCRSGQKILREIEVGHILVRGNGPEAEEKIEAIRQKLEGGANFEDLAAAESEDPSVSRNRGRLGFISRGQFVKAFDDVAFSMRVGSTSPPVKTRFGYHLIRVFGERTKAGVDCDNMDQQTETRLREKLTLSRRESEVKAYLVKLRKKAEIKVFNR